MAIFQMKSMSPAKYKSVYWLKAFMLFLIWVNSCSIASAQKYELTATVDIMFDKSDVECGSYFKVIFVTAKNKRWEWRVGFNAQEDEWKSYTKAFSTDAGDSVVKVITESERYYENAIECKHGDGGTREFVWTPSNLYPCGTVQKSSMFAGYVAGSKITISSRPISNIFAIETEVFMEPMNNYLSLASNVTLVYTNNSTEEVFSHNFGSVGSSSEPRSRGIIVKSNRNLKVKQIKVNTYYLRFVGGFPPIESENRTITIDVNDSFADFEHTESSPFYGLGVNSYVKVRYGKVDTPILYQGGTSNALPSENDITLDLQHGYSGFQWLYQVDGSVVWNSVPITFGNGGSITFSGEKLFGANYRDYLFKNVRFKAIYPCSPSTQTGIITLRHLPSAPGILLTDQVTETCAGFNDGKLKIKFKRPLYTFMQGGEEYKERVYVFLQREGELPPGETFEVFPNSLDADNSLFIENQQPDTFHISLLTTFVKTTNDSISLGNGYAEGADHFATQILPARPPITNFLTTASDVHCFDGADGVIGVSAAGGTGIYNAYLVSGIDTIQIINFAESLTSNFVNLTAGNYTVRLQDSNGCDVKDGLNNIIVLPMVINQPTTGTLISAVKSVEPLGFGLTNGHITVRSEGGTMPFSFEWKDGDDNAYTPEPSLIEGESMTSKLSSIGKGTYYVIARDSNYDLVTNVTEINLRGCYDTISIILDQPPLLEVYMDEYHYVSCYGYADGELVAHATGGRPYVSGNTYHPYQYEWFSVNGSTLTAFGVSDSIATERPSSFYRVKVTDRNGIIAWSPDFKLVQPDPLTITFNTSELLCNGDANGISTATVQGGTPVYQYFWSTEETTSVINNLTDGWYSLVVKDTRGCTTYGQTEVKVPNSLEADGELIYPTCNGYADGSISLTVTGGKTPYNYTWAQGATLSTIAGLGEGNYQVTITDANGCFIEREFLLEDPELLNLDLGADRVLCKEQTLPFNVTIDDPVAQYQWTRDGVNYATAATVDLVEPGRYVIVITDSKGCLHSDAISIARNEAEISSSIMVASRAPVGERVRIANISYPFPERVEWIIPIEAQVIEETSGYLDLLFYDKAAYTIGMTSYVGSCEKVSYTTVQIVDKSELKDYLAPDEPYIKQFMVTPNPNNGRFTATVELREIGDFSLTLYNNKGSVVEQKEIKSQLFIRVDFDASASVSTGIYLLQLTTTQGLSTFKIVIE